MQRSRIVDRSPDLLLSQRLTDLVAGRTLYADAILVVHVTSSRQHGRRLHDVQQIELLEQRMTDFAVAERNMAEQLLTSVRSRREFRELIR